MQYTNGNSSITLEEDGTRIIEFDGELQLEFPLNIDIRVSTECSFADNICKDFCHESAVRKGKDCNYEELKSKLVGLPKGIELAIGCNRFTTELYNFLSWCYDQEYVCNLTINQGHIKRDSLNLAAAINDGYVKGIGISYRSSLKWDIPEFILNYPNTVFHVISGIDTFEEVMSLKDRGVKKILILGEKDFGYNASKVDLTSLNHKQWYWWVGKLFKEFSVVSFDNLALQQLNLKRFFNDENWTKFNQGEYSFYIDAVKETFAPSSRSADRKDWKEYTIQQYFQSIQ